jgi:hypothetical protein
MTYYKGQRFGRFRWLPQKLSISLHKYICPRKMYVIRLTNVLGSRQNRQKRSPLVLRSMNIPQTVLIATLDTYDFRHYLATLNYIFQMKIDPFLQYSTTS